MADEVFIFQQNNALAHCVMCTSISGAASSWETQIHCSRHGRPTARKNQLINAFGEWYRNESTTCQYRTWQICGRRWWARWLAFSWV